MRLTTPILLTASIGALSADEIPGTITNTPPVFRSPDDDRFDLTSFLDQKNGFLSLVMPITEPAVGYGAAGGVAFLSQSLGQVKDGFDRPNRDTRVGSAWMRQ